MKRFLVTLLALSMMFAMAMPAFADTGDSGNIGNFDGTDFVYNDDLDLENNDTATHDVYACFKVTEESGFENKVYRVLVGWGAARSADEEEHPTDWRDWDYFWDEVTAVYKWNTDTLRYEATSKEPKNIGGDYYPFDIHVFNLSNAPVKAELAYTAREIEEGNPLSEVQDWGSADLSSDFPLAKALLKSSASGSNKPYAVIASCEDDENPQTAQGKVQGCEFRAVEIKMTEAGKNKAIEDSNIDGTAKTVLGTFTVTISAYNSGEN